MIYRLFNLDTKSTIGCYPGESALEAVDALLADYRDALGASRSPRSRSRRAQPRVRWRWNNRTLTNPSGAQKAGIVLLLILLIPPTLIPHGVMRFFGGFGFMHGRAYEPGPAWTLGSAFVFYGLLAWLI